MGTINGLNTDGLVAVVKTIKENWMQGRTVWAATTKWKDGFQVTTKSRDFADINVDEPEMLCGTDTAANPVELVLQAYGACLTIGFVMNAAVRGIKIESLETEIEGEIDLPGFLGLEAPEELGMDKLPGYKNITAKIKVKSDADADTLNALLGDVTRTSPVGVTLSRAVDLNAKLEVL